MRSASRCGCGTGDRFLSPVFRYERQATRSDGLPHLTPADVPLLMRACIDSNIVIALLEGDGMALCNLDRAPEVFIPAVAPGEFFFGVGKSGRPSENTAKVERFAAGRAIVSCDLDVARECGRLKQRLEGKENASVPFLSLPAFRAASVRLSTGCLKRRIWSAACATTGWTQGWLPTFAPAGVRCWCGMTWTKSGIAGGGGRWPTARRACALCAASAAGQ